MKVDPQLLATILIIAIVFLVVKPKSEGYTDFAGNTNPAAIAAFRQQIKGLNTPGDTIICTVKPNVPKPTPVTSAVKPGAPIAIAQPLMPVGKMLQGVEKDISVPTTFPNCGVVPGSPVKYTLTMTLTIEKMAPNWRNIFIRGGADNNRRPGIYINPNTLKFHYRHGSTADGNSGIDITNTALLPGVPTKLAFINDGQRLSVYVNGIKDTAEYVLPAGKTFMWGTDDTAKAAIAPWTASAAGYVKVKNMTWYNSVLTPDQIKRMVSVEVAVVKKGFVPIKTVTRSINVTPNSPTAPTPGDSAVSDGTPLTTWNLPELKEAAFIRFDNKHVFKVRNKAYYNFYGYFIDSAGNKTIAPFTTQTRYTSFEIGNFF